MLGPLMRFARLAHPHDDAPSQQLAEVCQRQDPYAGHFLRLSPLCVSIVSPALQTRSVTPAGGMMPSQMILSSTMLQSACKVLSS